MTIDIITLSYPLPYVLLRTSPAGVNVTPPEFLASSAGGGPAYRVTIAVAHVLRDIAAKAIPDWISDLLQRYGAQHVAIDGVSVAPTDYPEIKSTLAKATAARRAPASTMRLQRRRQAA